MKRAPICGRSSRASLAPLQFSRKLERREFSVFAQLPSGSEPFRVLELSTDRTFVPDRIQRNGDRRKLGLRVYGMSVRGQQAP